MRRRLKVPTRLFTLMVLCFVGFNGLFLLLSGIVYYGTYSDIANREIRMTKKELLDVSSEKLSSYVSGIQDSARFVVTNALIQSYLSDSPKSRFEFVTESRDLYEEFLKLASLRSGLYSIELYTNWIGSYTPFQDRFLHPLADAEEEGWLARLDRADGFWLPAHDDPALAAGKRMVGYVQRIIGNKGESLGIIKINIPEADLLLQLAKNDEGSFFVLRDSGGNVIASALPEGLPADPSSEEYARALHGTDYTVIESDSGSEYWTVRQLISKDVFGQSGKRIQTIIIVLLSVLIALSIPLALWVSKKLTSPIHRIVEGMKSLEKGDFGVRVEAVTTTHEYAYLTTSFNRMVQRLKDLIGRLNEEHRSRRESELQLLQSHIKPHFLYNTLDLIHWKALDHDAQEISRMVLQLSKLFRLGLGNGNWYATIRDELAHARCYMAIQGYRSKFPIDYREDVPRELLDCLVPKIILQPFLENAVIHGFRQKREGAAVGVSFELRESGADSCLVVTVADNGSGLPEGFESRERRGIGIRNIEDRIQLYCGPRYGVKVKPGEAGGTTVVMTLPLIRDEEELEQWRKGLSHEYDSLGG
ncbi:sensor histidine kinase [Cohnella fermenti]|nr:sensor histidine kinase [Cohnella fermenti]